MLEWVHGFRHRRRTVSFEVNSFENMLSSTTALSYLVAHLMGKPMMAGSALFSLIMSLVQCAPKTLVVVCAGLLLHQYHAFRPAHLMLPFTPPRRGQ